MINPNPSESLPSPPSLMKAMTAGFDAISNHIWLVVFTFALDMLLWIGPRLRIYSLFKNALSGPAGFSNLGDQQYIENLAKSIQEFNFLNLLRTFPVGIPSLMVSRVPLQTPLGTPESYEINSLGAVFLIWFFITLVGITAGAFYFSLVAQVALSGKVAWNKVLGQMPGTFVQIFLLSLSWIALLFGIGLPFSCILSIVLVAGINLEEVFVLLALLAGGLLIWLLIPLIFSPHGIIVNQDKVWRAARNSIRIARMTLPTTSLLVLVLVVISEGMSMLWSIPADTSWLTTVGIVGHAFISTSLLATSFIYFREADSWSKEVLEKTRLSLA